MGVCKAGINTDETLWSETNVCLTLESMANYLLAKHIKDKKDNIKIYDSYELFIEAIVNGTIIPMLSLLLLIAKHLSITKAYKLLHSRLS